jgi:ribokinase
MSGVLVVGSANVDHVVQAARLPRPGETVADGTYRRHFGGKGANQAVAAARVGSPVVFVGAVGEDDAGRASLASLRIEGVDVERVHHIPDVPTGVALIAVAPDGENQIVVASGANAFVTADDARSAILEATPRVVLAVLEIPVAAVVAAARAAARTGAVFILDPAPGQELPRDLLATGPILTPNLGELRAAAGVATDAEPEAAVARLLAAGAVAVLVTRGDAGVNVHTAGERWDLPARTAGRVVDTTGAGDTFAGVLAAWIAQGHRMNAAVEAANAAAALSVTASGARAGMPTSSTLRAFLREGRDG